jgi:hypothetical protein
MCSIYRERFIIVYMNIDIKSKAKTTTILQLREYYIRFPLSLLLAMAATLP